jgi:hypothetical protein
MSEAIVFAATCQECKREQLQEGYTIADLSRLLGNGDPIEAYCEFCDEFWAIELQKRVELSAFVAAASEGPPPTTRTLEDGE